MKTIRVNGLTINDLVRIANENKIDMDAPLYAMGAYVEYVYVGLDESGDGCYMSIDDTFKSNVQGKACKK